MKNYEETSELVWKYKLYKIFLLTLSSLISPSKYIMKKTSEMILGHFCLSLILLNDRQWISRWLLIYQNHHGLFLTDWMEKAVRRCTASAQAQQINVWHLISHTSCKQSINVPALALNTNSIHMTRLISACPILHAKWRLDTGSGWEICKEMLPQGPCHTSTNTSGDTVSMLI